MPNMKKKVKDCVLWCHCKEINEDARPMVQCDSCDFWFHLDCVNLLEDLLLDEPERDWICSDCEELIATHQNLKSGLVRTGGHVTPINGWTQCVVLERFPIQLWAKVLDDSSSSSSSSLPPSEKSRKEGYNLFHSDYVEHITSALFTPFLFFCAWCHATMKKSMYQINICFKNSDFLWAFCQCKAGVDGQCKHVVAVLFSIEHHVLSNKKVFDEDQAPTERRQLWHIKKPSTDEPCLFAADGWERPDVTKSRKRPHGERVTQYAENMDFHLFVSKDSLKTLHMSLPENLPISQTIKDHHFCPVAHKEAVYSLADGVFSSMKNVTYASDYEIIFSEEIQRAKLFYTTQVKLEIDQAVKIEEQTRLQSRSLSWRKQRFNRLTSSHFKTFSRLKDSTDPVKTHLSLNNYFHSSSVQHGKKYEPVAAAKFLQSQIIPIERHSVIGLCVNPKISWAGASPDLVVLSEGEIILIEIKCPYSLYRDNKKVLDSVGESFYIRYGDGGTLEVNKSHSVYYQMQGQLNICNVDTAYLVVFVPPDDYVVVKVDRDIVFFNSISEKLASVYFKSLLPFLAATE